MGFKKGESGNPSGKPKGALNILTKTVKERVLGTFEDLQQEEETSLTGWAKTNLTEFYKIASKLIPTEVNATINKVGKDLEDETYS